MQYHQMSKVFLTCRPVPQKSFDNVPSGSSAAQVHQLELPNHACACTVLSILLTNGSCNLVITIYSVTDFPSPKTSMDKELAAGSSPERLNIWTEISDDWCPTEVSAGTSILYYLQ